MDTFVVVVAMVVAVAETEGVEFVAPSKAVVAV